MPPPPRTGGPPVTNIRNTTSPHWRGWLKPENRCLVPANSFAEYAPGPERPFLGDRMAGVLAMICPTAKAKFCPTGCFVAVMAQQEG
jgi:putative SOS response-associated peptidase YedK